MASIPIAGTAVEDLATLQRLNDEYIRAVRTSDTNWFEQHLAPDFVNGNPDGTVSDRATFLASIARPLPLAEFRAHDVRIRVLGGLAIAQGRTAYRKPDGQPGAGSYTDLYARRGGRWACIAADVMRG
jgi:hypothetical protein